VGAPFALVVVPDVETRPTALGIVRCLGRAGVPVAVAAATRDGPSFWSRYTRRRLLCPPLNGAPEDWQDALVHFGESFDERPVLFASSDEHVVAIHHYRRDLSRAYRYPFLESDALHACLDKREMYARCRAAGIETGEVIAVIDPDGLERVAREAVLPAVLKPAMWADVDAPRPGRNKAFMAEFGEKAVPVHTVAELTAALRRASRLSVPVLLQELVPGPSRAIVHVSVYADSSSNIRGLFVARKTVQYPSQFGNACFLETMPYPEAGPLAASLVRSLHYRGVAGAIEFKQHPRTGRLHFIEINPRAAGSVAAAEAAGVNLPHLAYLDMIGGTLPAMTRGERVIRWAEGRDTLRSWLSYRTGDHTGEPFTLRRFARTVSSATDYAYWAADDPLPWAARVARTPADLARHLLTRSLHVQAREPEYDPGRQNRGAGGLMSSEGSNANAIMQYSFLRVFANDGTIDADELAFLERLALRDGQVDDAERVVLLRILGRVSADTVAPTVWDEIQRFKARHSID
jgi:predicted ATP-grasp superfamily ATP-dependent carboligase